MNLLAIFEKSILYIEDNLCEKISVRDVADHVYVSNYYFQRTFSIFSGMSVGEYIRSRRLSCAAEELLRADRKIIDLAFKYGYETPESFARAFKRFHGVSPKDVRTCPYRVKLFPKLEIVVSIEGGKTMECKIEKREAFKIVIVVKKFKEGSTSVEEVPLFWGDYMKKGYHKDVPPMLGVCLPTTDKGKKEFEYGIGSVEECVTAIPKGFVTHEVPACTWAQFRCKGPMPQTIQKLWKQIYTEWLPNSKYEVISGYDFECYDEGDIHSPDYGSGIWIPVRIKK